MEFPIAKVRIIQYQGRLWVLEKTEDSGAYTKVRFYLRDGDDEKRVLVPYGAEAAKAAQAPLVDYGPHDYSKPPGNHALLVKWPDLSSYPDE